MPYRWLIKCYANSFKAYEIPLSCGDVKEWIVAVVTDVGCVAFVDFIVEFGVVCKAVIVVGFAVNKEIMVKYVHKTED